MKCLLFSALMFEMKFVKRYPASITYLCHQYLITTFSQYNVGIILDDVSDIIIFLLQNVNISISRKNLLSVGPYSW